MKKILFIPILLLFIVGCGTKNNTNNIATQNDIDATIIKTKFVSYLESLILEDGSFQYIVNLNQNKSLDEYDILRHSLSYYAILKEYERDQSVLSKNKTIIEKGIDFTIPRIIVRDDKAYVIAENMSDIACGDCSLVLILMCEYQKAYGDLKYQDYISKLANGLLFMQRDEGRFNHLYHADKMTLKEKDVIIYYDGEAVLALCKTYGLLKDKKYLDSAKKAIDYYISMEYEKFSDHWQEYTIAEFLNYNEGSQYIEYAILNLESKMDSIVNKDGIYNTDLEVIKTGIEVFEKFNYMNTKYTLAEIKSKYISEIDKIEKIYVEVQDNASFIESFFAKKGKKSIRIDDLAHYILGLGDFITE